MYTLLHIYLVVLQLMNASAFYKKYLKRTPRSHVPHMSSYPNRGKTLVTHDKSWQPGPDRHHRRETGPALHIYIYIVCYDIGEIPIIYQQHSFPSVFTLQVTKYWTLLNSVRLLIENLPMYRIFMAFVLGSIFNQMCFISSTIPYSITSHLTKLGQELICLVFIFCKYDHPK